MIDNILIVDDEFLIRQLLEETAMRRGIEATTASSAEAAIDLLKKNDYQMAFVDFKMGKKTGIDVLKFAQEHAPNMLLVIMTAYGTLETATEAIKLGAFDFVIKPFTPDQMDILIEKGKLWLQMSEQKNYLQKAVTQSQVKSSRTIGKSRAITEIRRLLERVAPTRATVLVTGKSGTGKELIASEIHALSDPNNTKPYIRMNCAAVPEALLESELFGHEKGAFTGAIERRIGRFELADGGTLLLDEIGEISMNMQAKLLRVLQESEFERVGGTKTIKVDVRIIATTNRDLQKEVEAGNFREDLYYRLNVFPLHLPDLKDREGDAALIASEFIEKQGKALGRSLQFSKDALEVINNYSWPGNIRELENVIERIAILEDGPIITKEAFPDDILNPKTSVFIDENSFDLKEIEKKVIYHALEKTKGNKTKAADLLGFSTRTLRNKLNEYKDAGFEFAGIAV